MPKYVYYCKKCDDEFELRHSLKEVVQICQLCDTIGEVMRRPSTIFLSKKNSDFGTKTKAGSVVKATIEEAKEELKQEQEKFSQRKYKNNE